MCRKGKKKKMQFLMRATQHLIIYSANNFVLQSPSQLSANSLPVCLSDLLEYECDLYAEEGSSSWEAEKACLSFLCTLCLLCFLQNPWIAWYGKGKETEGEEKKGKYYDYSWAHISISSSSAFSSSSPSAPQKSPPYSHRRRVTFEECENLMKIMP